ncbi:MAG: CoB--CoM heterodisulfide reductase iron-sulfur subunit B family protein [Firmicutes bacterium]|nr:CoB--CoM heterodisulfide reductase iron-sulfur subunit B family protein [Bacillota bacterium]
MKYAYYPGCSLSSTGIEYGMSTQAVAPKLGIELNEIPDWNCCGASSAHCTDHQLALALPARTLAQAEGMEMDIAVPCAGCFNRLRGAEAAIKDPKQKAKLEEILGQPLSGKVKSYSLLDIIVNQVGVDTIKTQVEKPLTGLKIAAYYGCLLVRPQNVTGFDDTENPQSMDKLMNALGGVALDWPYKVECCGGNLAIPRTDIMMKMSYDVIRIAKASGADCIVTACPLCQVNLEMRQTDMEKTYHTKLGFPIFYFTELIGLALGIEPGALGMNKHFVSPAPFFKQWEANIIADREAKAKAAAEAKAKAEAAAAKAAAAKAKSEAAAKEGEA